MLKQTYKLFDTMYAGVCRFLFWLNLLTPYLLCLQGDKNLPSDLWLRAGSWNLPQNLDSQQWREELKQKCINRLKRCKRARGGAASEGRPERRRGVKFTRRLNLKQLPLETIKKGRCVSKCFRTSLYSFHTSLLHKLVR